MNGYELPIAMEVRRGRYLRSYEHPGAADREPAAASGRFRCAITTMLFSRATG
jgi:hypothetical protein